MSPRGTLGLVFAFTRVRHGPLCMLGGLAYMFFRFSISIFVFRSYNNVNGSISTSTAFPGISFASQNVIAPLSNFVNTDRLGDFSKN